MTNPECGRHRLSLGIRASLFFRRWSFVIRDFVALFALAFAVRAYAAEPDAPKPVEPVAERKFEVPPWPRATMMAPWGNSGLGGGPDKRIFCFSPDGRFIVGATVGAWELEAWDAESGGSLGRFGALHFLTDLCLSPNGTRAITVEYANEKIDLWDWKNRKHLRSLDEWVAGESFSQVAFLDENRCVLTGKKGELCVWDLNTADELVRWQVLPRGEKESYVHVRAMAVSPDGSAIAVLEETLLYTVDSSTGKLLRRLGHFPRRANKGNYGSWNDVGCMEYSRDGRVLALGCENGIRLYDAASGEQRPPLVSHSGGVRALHFTADGKALLSLGKDNRLLTWDAAEILGQRIALDPLTDEQIEQACLDIGGEDAWQSYVAVERLRLAPEKGLAQLRRSIHPAIGIDQRRVDEITAQLMSDDINVRRAGARAMRHASPEVLDALRHKEFRRMVAEKERRGIHVNWTLDAYGNSMAWQLHQVELIHVLPLLGTPEAKAFAQELATGSQRAMLTEAAQEVLANWPAQ